MKNSSLNKQVEHQPGGRMARGVGYLIERNQEHSRQYLKAESQRDEYRQQHPTEILVMKCMDGRLNASVWTETPFGILNPMRNIGSRFSLGWVGLHDSVKAWYDYAQSCGRNCLVLVTYHFSRGEKHRGCAGFGYDDAAASLAASELKKQFERTFVQVYGRERFDVIKVGLETDLESLIFHNDASESVDLASLGSTSERAVQQLLTKLYSGYHEQYVRDLLPLAIGNLRHIEQVRKSDRNLAIDAEHGEWVLWIGRGADWLHEVNTALIINPFDYELPEVIETAANLLLANLVEERVRGRIVLVASAPYYEERELQRLIAIEKARELNAMALRVIQRRAPLLMRRLDQLTCTVNMNQRLMNVLDMKQVA